MINRVVQRSRYIGPVLPPILLDREGRYLPVGWQLVAPKEIAELVERFESNKESSKSGHYISSGEKGIH